MGRYFSGKYDDGVIAAIGDIAVLAISTIGFRIVKKYDGLVDCCPASVTGNVIIGVDPSIFRRARSATELEQEHFKQFGCYPAVSDNITALARAVWREVNLG